MTMRSGFWQLAAWLVSFTGTTWLPAQENWPQFRGPTGQGFTPERSLPICWGGPKQENVAWKSPIIGQGHASPIVWQDRVFVATAHWPPNTSERSKVIPEHHLLCYGASDGRQLWDTLIPPGPWLRTDFRSGPGGGYACPTPATDGRLVFCAFGSAVMAALDFEGRIVWRKEIVPYSFDVTLGSSPVVFGDTVILVCAMAKPSDSRVLALEKQTGKVKWEQKLANTGFGHSTPLLIEVEQKPQLLVLASAMGVANNALQSLEPATGRLLWWCRGAGDAASPVYAHGQVYFDSGRGGPGVCVQPTGVGDLTASHIQWTIPQIAEGIGSPIIVSNWIYRLQGSQVLKCLDRLTGKRVFEARLEAISSTWASPVADAQGRIYFANSGRSYVLQAGPELKVLAVNDLSEPNHASAAISRGRLFLLGTNHLFCIRQP
jgi:outer membrane protein assembly factor BamB